MFFKKKRIVNKKLLQTYRSMTCAANDKCFGEVCAHHLKTKGSGGDDTPGNLIPLCMKHHEEIHKIGPVRMMAEYYGIHEYLCKHLSLDFFHQMP